MAEQQKQYITPETKAKLEAELQSLIDTARSSLRRLMSAARKAI